MIDIGIAGLDTSHAEAFADILSDMDDARIAGVWDGGDVRETTYIESFCDDYGAQRHDTIDSLVDAVDAGMVLTANWDTHRSLGTQFLRAGRPTLIDKPLAGCVSDLLELERAAEEASLFGGSAVPFHTALNGLPRGGSDRTLYAAGYNDYFYYRVHLTDTVRLLADSDWVSVHPGDEPGTTVDVQFESGTHATLRFDGSPDDSTFSVLDVGDRTQAIELENGEAALERMYPPFLRAFLAVARGEQDDTDRLIDSGSLLLAVEAALTENSPVERGGSSSLESVHVDGEAFLADYDPYY